MKETNGMDLAAPGHMWMWMSRQADTYCIGDILLRSRTWISTYILCPSFQQASSRSSSWHGHWTHFYTGACFEVRFLVCFEACLKKITIHLWIRREARQIKTYEQPMLMWDILFADTAESPFTAVSVRGGNRLLLPVAVVQFRVPSCDSYTKAFNKVKLVTHFPLWCSVVCSLCTVQSVLLAILQFYMICQIGLFSQTSVFQQGSWNRCKINRHLGGNNFTSYHENIK